MPLTRLFEQFLNALKRVDVQSLTVAYLILDVPYTELGSRRDIMYDKPMDSFVVGVRGGFVDTQ